VSIDELGELHALINSILAARLVAKKDKLERRLRLLDRKVDPAAT
jgi:DNA-binding protein H-NS